MNGNQVRGVANTGPIIRAVVSCDQPGCACHVAITTAGTADQCEGVLETARKTAIKLGWAMDLPEVAQIARPDLFPTPDGYSKDASHRDKGGSLCPEHRPQQ